MTIVWGDSKIEEEVIGRKSNIKCDEIVMKGRDFCETEMLSDSDRSDDNT